MMHFVAFALLVFSGVVYGRVVPQGLVPVGDGRIYGGSPAQLGQFPYTASLRYFGLHRCGAVLYRHDAVLTAAHCTHELEADLMEVSMGTLYRNRGGQERFLRLYIMHEDFNPVTFKNDIAIVIMERSVDFSNNLHPIALASIGEDLRGGTVVTISGWGSLNDEGHLPELLSYVKVNVVDRSTCAALYEGRNDVESDMICAGDDGGGKDSCSGDSGGPLIVENKLYGLVSWGDDCGRPDSPGVYANVAAHRPWIESHYY